MLKSIRKVNTVVILVSVPVLLIVISSFFPLTTWISLWLALLIGYVGYFVNLFITWLLLHLAYGKGIAQKSLHEFSEKWAKIIIIALLIVIIISFVMAVLEVPVMKPIIMTAFNCMAIPAAYLASNGVFADIEME